ncbi:restriction endonuclease subunit S [Pseudomonas sp. Z1-12]|uniref:restriction endonuclease subunit S n=1 Tax=Pseudomonas sp. Z1-12 TaxID=2817408 RepID=UPI003DA8110C
MDSDVEWKDLSLGDVIELKRGYDLPKGKRMPGSVPIVSSSGVSDFHSEAMVEGPGVVTGRYGTIGEVFYVDEDYWPLNTTLYVRDFKDNDPRFISYLLRTLDFQAYSDKGAVPGLNRNHLHLAKVRLPGKTVQKSIVRVLSSLDSKIDLNCRINQTLEATAQAIFKSWFVDFDPVKAKIAAQAEGRDPLRAAMCAISGKPDAELNALPNEQYEQLAATAVLFPDEMEASELGEIPKGWSHEALAQLTDKIGSGSTPRGGKEVYLEEGVALIRSQNVYDSLFVWEGLARISDEAATQLKGVTVQEDDVLLNITGASILRTCVVEPDALPARVNQHVAIIRAKAGVPPRFIHMHLLRPEIKSYLLGLNAGASREAITKAHIESLTLLTPGPLLLAAFQTATAPLFRQVQRFAQQMRVLDELRNTLLPKLLSGELSVEALAEPAGAA